MNGGAFWLKSEFFLTKIRTANFDCRASRGRTKTERSGGQKGRGLRGRNFCPPSLSAAAEFRASFTGAPSNAIFLIG